MLVFTWPDPTPVVLEDSLRLRPPPHAVPCRVKDRLFLVERLSKSIGFRGAVEPIPAVFTSDEMLSEQSCGRKRGDLGMLWVPPQRMAIVDR
jgi:hypothetical protein